MAHIGTLRDFRFKGDVDDIRGANLYGRGGEKLGEVKDVIFDHASCTIQYLVVDTGGWLSSKDFLVPADRINSHSENNRDFSCNLTKDQIERFPEYHGEAGETDNQHWGEYESRYRNSYVTDGDVLHREGSDHIITPEATELPPPAENTSGVDFTPNRISDPFKQPNNPMRDDVRLRPSGIASRAEDTRMPGSALHTEDVEWERREPKSQSSGRDIASRDIADRDERDLGAIRNKPIERDYVSHENASSEPVPIDRELNERVSNVSAREDLGDVDVNAIRPDLSDVDRSAYGDLNRSVPMPASQDPPSYRVNDRNLRERVGDEYPVMRVDSDQNEVLEHNRLRDFEEHLRRNRVDITASCRACGVDKKDRAA